MLVVILLIKNSKRIFLENSKDEVGTDADGTVTWRLIAQIEEWALV